MKIGIDPGITGAIAILEDSLRCVGIYDMPTMALGLKRWQVNAPELGKILLAVGLRYCSDKKEICVYLEQVNAMPGQGVTSMFNFGTSYGIVIGVAGALGLSLSLVRPNAWKKTAGLIGKPKDAARTLAQQLYPDVDLAHKKDVGRADALLIARFGWIV
jgi:crossover junction endodeoxyribonuclease RuvC